MSLEDLKHYVDSLALHVAELELTVESFEEGGSDARRKLFSTPQSTWSWTHGLGVWPPVIMFVDGLGLVIPDVEYLDDNNLVIELPAPSTGFLDIV